MNQRYGITRILFNQSLTCPIAFAEMIRRFGIMTETEQTTFITSLDVGEVGAMMYALAKFGDPLLQFMLGIDLEVGNKFMIGVVAQGAALMHMDMDTMLEGDQPVELQTQGAIYLITHMQP